MTNQKTASKKTGQKETPQKATIPCKNPLGQIDFENWKTSFRKDLLEKIRPSFGNEGFLYLDTQPYRLAYDLSNDVAWLANPESAYNKENGQNHAAQLQYGGLSGWALPSYEQLHDFVKLPNNPMRDGQAYRLFAFYDWLCERGKVDIDSGCFSVSSSSHGLFICRKNLTPDEFATLVSTFHKHQWKPALEPEQISLLEPYFKNDLSAALPRMDHDACRLPLLKPEDWSDPEKGLWEAWGQPPAVLEKLGIRPRDPARDVHDGDWVAIDFGTSSTVVAWHNGEKNSAELMRVGAKDFHQASRAGDYENPTVLEFLDLPALLEAWRACAYRPDVCWDDVRCSHEALHDWRHNESDPRVVGSVLGKIKQWALRGASDAPLRLGDQAGGSELELAPLSLRTPVRGQPLAVSKDDPFDPVELYAWFLGMNINWRGRGIFLKYAMTFPVKYPQEVKERILASFSRGLQRSLPPALVMQPDWLQKFEVVELASEPVAYAALALPALGVAPGQARETGYAVFDFGGGTADFDFGFYRLPTPEEEESGVEVALERCGSEGDALLGGENLLENLAYRTFRHNEALCREKKITFTRPLGERGFAGDELLLDKTRAAMTNTLMLMSALRPLWETGELPAAESGVLRLNLLTRDGERAACELAIDQAGLLQWLAQRLEQGVKTFYTALKRAFEGRMPERVHVLLAGNSSRSRMVADLFGLKAGGQSKGGQSQNGQTDGGQSAKPGEITLAEALYSWAEEDGDSQLPGPEDKAAQAMNKWRQALLGERAPVFEIHPPLAGNAQDLYSPTGKTGVALGLLKLCPGSAIEVLDKAREQSGGESPFAWYVGSDRRGAFTPALHHGAPYGQWQPVGVPRNRAFNLYYTNSPRASTGELPASDGELRRKTLHLAGGQHGERLFARATGPDTIEICTAASAEEAGRDNVQTLTLKA